MVIEAANGTDSMAFGVGNTANMTAYGNISMNTTGKIVNMANPTSAQDAATKAYVDAASSTAGLTQIATSTPTGVSTVTFSAIPQTYRGLLLAFNGLSCDTASRNLIIRNDVGAGTGNSNLYAKKITGTTVTAAAGTGDLLATSTTLTAAQTIGGYVKFMPYQAITITPAKIPMREFSSLYLDSVGATATVNGGQECEGASDTGVASITLLWNSTGNFDAGTVTLYGIN